MALTETEACAAARELWEHGCTMFPVDETLVRPAREAFKEFVFRRRDLADHLKWLFCIPGEEEADVGLTYRGGGEKDWKWFFHDNLFLRQQLALVRDVDLAAADRAFLAHNQALANHACAIGTMLAQAFDRNYQLGLTDAYRASCEQVLPYGTSTLRSLYYPAGPRQRGARAHPDKSLFSIHFGDEGGQLLALSGKDDSVGTPISPPPGYAVAFLGVKIREVSDNQVQPLWHRSTADSHQDRFAFVHFAHVHTNYQVVDAFEAERYYDLHYASTAVT